MNKLLRMVTMFLLLFSATTLAYASGTYQEGDQGPEVSAIQSRLTELAYNVGSPDGDFGEMTTNAVKAFQTAHGLDADGVIGEQTYRLLMGREIPASRGSSSSVVRRVIQTAMGYVGVPYSYGGTTPAGFDCSGFTRYVFAQSGIGLFRAADEQYEMGREVSDLRIGDLVFFSTYAEGVSHVGIYLGSGKFISATSSHGIAVERLDSGYWGACYIGARRIL